MSVVVIRQDGKIDDWLQVLQNEAPHIRFYSFLDDHPRQDIEVAFVWKHPPGVFKQYPNLQYIASFGAGVDFLLDDKEVPNVPITRVIDPVLASDMSEFTIGAILAHLKNFHQYSSDQRDGIWEPLGYRRIDDIRVGIMGLGALGLKLSEDLKALKFNILGWSKLTKSLRDVDTFSANTGLGEFLSLSDILVCLLPLTDETRGILNKELFSQLPRGAYIINVARGGHLVDEDLVTMIDSGHLSGACLDVYHKEPLNADHPFWDHPKIFMTPHVASVSDIESVVPQLLENYNRFKKGLPLLNQVSTVRGY